ncbi:unnamed protein product [Arabidopsis lyrata]|nr:unnamed protein product [Arabidopsis lyrata]
MLGRRCSRHCWREDGLSMIWCFWFLRIYTPLFAF